MTTSAPTLPFSRENLKALPWIMLFSRFTLFLGIQALIALGFYLAGAPAAWSQAAAWWPLVVVLANLVCLAVLTRLFRAAGKNYWEIYRIRRENVKADLLAMLGVLLIAAPAGFFPNILLAGWLFGSPQTALDLLMRPLPLGIVYVVCILLFPLTQGMVEIPTYFSYAMPGLRSQGQPRWLSVATPVLMLGLQHIAVPFLFDFRFIAYRALMFLPFALVIGLVLNWRPRLLPYIAILHVLMDLSLGVMFLTLAY
jgi:hypothetical protein